MPDCATPKVKEFARQLLAYEAAARKTPGANPSAAFRVCEKLRELLSSLAGTAGFRSLLARAVALANQDVRWLKAVHVKSDGTLEGLGELEQEVSRSDFAKGEINLIACLLGLLVTFIGEDLTLRLVRDVWPEAPFGALDSATEESHETE
jgi:hypothetical protein